jgi:hypothetical protein
MASILGGLNLGGLTGLLNKVPVVGGLLNKVVSGVQNTVNTNAAQGAPTGPAGVAIAVTSASPTGDTFLDSMVRKALIIGIGFLTKMLRLPGPIAGTITNVLVPAALFIEHEITHHQAAVATAVAPAPAPAAPGV